MKIDKIINYIKENKKYVLIGLAVLLVTVIYFWPVQKATPPEETYYETSENKPQEEISHEKETENIKNLLTVERTNPRNLETNIFDLDKIEIFLANKIDESTKENLKFRINPKMNFEDSWPGQYKVELILGDKLEKNTTYTVTLVYKDTPIHEFKFTTSEFGKEEYSSLVEEQLKNDIEFAEAEAETFQKWPFLTKLPIDTESYVIIYDYQKEMFRIRLKISEDSSEFDKLFALDLALAHLEGLYINPNDWGGYYVLYKGQKIPE
ncbi:hypothetical protein JXA34_03605 [Patescibacteria group bacterium]|nr:hypothetical protein [Patescibacteria group bacterium]